MASASGTRSENFKIQELSAGSVVVVAEICRSAGSDCDPTAVAAFLRTQAEQVVNSAPAILFKTLLIRDGRI